MYRLAVLLGCFVYLSQVAAQTSKGSFGLVTTDPICVQCDYATVAWYGGIGPYVLSVSGQHNTYKLANVGLTATNQMKWHVNFPTGTELWFQLKDSNETDIYTNIVSVSASSDASCVNVTNPLVTDASTSTVLSSTSSALSTSTAGAAAASNSASPNPNSSTSSSHSSTGPIVGGIVAGVVALLLLLLLVLWRRRRANRQSSVLGSKHELDLSEVHNGMIVQPFVPPAQASQTTQHVYSKVGSAPPAGISATDLLSSSNAGPSAATASSSTSQSAYEAPLPASRPTIASRKHARPEVAPEAPVQESDAGVRLMGGTRPEQPSTLPPAYDSSWRE